MELMSTKIPRNTKLVGGKGYAHLRGHVENGLDIVGTDGGVGWAGREVVVKVVH